MKKVTAIILIVVGVLAGIGFGMMKFASKVAGSIGIIGGADGPTAIFVSGPEGVFPWALLLVAIVALIVGVCLLVRKKK